MKQLFGILTTWAMVLTLRESCVLGELTILREALIASKTYSNTSTRRLTCVSGDHSSALVWNLDYTDNENPTTLKKFEESRTDSSTIKCPLNETGGCMGQWQTVNWTITNSAVKPMGPVMDRRWEDFENIGFLGDKREKKTIKVQASEAIIFSVRGTITVEILLSQHFDEGIPCYLIVIGEMKGETSFICEHVWKTDRQQTPGPECLKTKSFGKHKESPLSLMEWRTFILKWNKENRTVTVYDKKERIISQTFTEWHTINVVSFFSGSNKAQYRFHKYNYLHTTKKNTQLLSPRIPVINSTLCFEMLMGLCATCKAKINIRSRSIIESASFEVTKSERNSKGDGLPMWQLVRFNRSIPKSYGTTILLQIITLQSRDDSNPLWAVANFQTCRDKDTVRRSSIEIEQVSNERNRTLSWPKINCQKLSYDGGSLVSSDSDIQPELKHGMPLCNGGKVGPNCRIDCSSIYADASCRNLAICIDRGCVCAIGWQGKNCDTACTNKFGYNCELPCGHCKDTACDANSGTCPATCDRDFFTPYCEGLERPDVVWVNETSAVVTLHAMRYDKRLDYTLLIQEGNGTESLAEVGNKVWKNTSTLEIIIINLQPNTVYEVRGAQFLREERNKLIGGPGRKFITNCKPSKNYELEPGKRNIALQIIRDEQDQYACPSTWYRVDINNLPGNYKLRISRTAFTYVFLNLTPSTEYNVTISGGGEIWYKSSTKTTSESAPPPVRKLDVYERNNKTVLLRWLPPKPKKREIENYRLSHCTNYTCSTQITILPNQTCKLWRNYICYEDEHFNMTTEYKVWVKYRGINTLGTESTIDSRQESSKAPQAPKNLTAEKLEKGVVILQWPHPWKTNGKLDKFIIEIEELSSDLQKNLSQNKYSQVNYTVIEYEVNYTIALYLQPSTMYNFTVYANTVDGIIGKPVSQDAWTPPALEFKNRLKLADNQPNHTILLELPSIYNNTVDSVMHIIVKGGVPCEELNTLNDTLKFLINLTESENAWIAASLKAAEMMEEQNFTIGDNQTNNGILNCPLKLGGTYDIVVIVEGGTKPTKNMTIVSKFLHVKLPGGSTKPSLVWLFVIPIILALVLLISCVLLLRKCKRRSKRNSSQDMTQSSQRDVSLLLEMPETSPSRSRMTWRHSNEYLPGVTGAAKPVPAEYEYICLVRNKDFEEYIRNSVDTDELRNQFAKFPRGKKKPWDCGMLLPNRKKNRDQNLIAYDETRVVLEKLPRDHHSDYINANYIDGYNKKKAYIATQGPMARTVPDFWRMIWQEDVQIICMMTTVGETKCEQYWPEFGMKMKYGKITILTMEQMICADYTHRTLEVTCSGQARKIDHLQYTAWPERGVPTYFHSLVLYLRKLQSLHPGNGPVVVHCSTGAGPTGIVILCDTCLRRIAETGVIDVVTGTEDILRQRANMMNDYQEYLLVHLLIVECLQSQQTTLPCDDSLPTNISRMRQNLTDQLKRLNESTWQDTILLQDAQRPQLLRTGETSAHPDIVPVTNEYACIDVNHVDQNNSIYISADYVDGVKLKNQYVTRPLPSPSTFSDFWEMIVEQKVELILILQSPETENAVYCDVVKGSEFNPSSTLKVTVRSETDGEFPTQKLRLIDTSRKTERIQLVTILRCKGWTVKMGAKPPSADTLVRLWQTSEKISRGGPAAIVCPDGLTGCGLYLSASFLLERMSVEQECDVCFAIRTVRRSKLQFMPTLEQFNVLYDAAVKYCECFETYANFK